MPFIILYTSSHLTSSYIISSSYIILHHLISFYIILRYHWTPCRIISAAEEHHHHIDCCIESTFWQDVLLSIRVDIESLTGKSSFPKSLAHFSGCTEEVKQVQALGLVPRSTVSLKIWEVAASIKPFTLWKACCHVIMAAFAMTNSRSSNDQKSNEAPPHHQGRTLKTIEKLEQKLAQGFNFTKMWMKATKNMPDHARKKTQDIYIYMWVYVITHDQTCKSNITTSASQG